MERYQARENGEDPPAYAPDELTALHAKDLNTASGGGMVGALRDSGGWESPEGAEGGADAGETERERAERLRTVREQAEHANRCLWSGTPAFVVDEEGNVFSSRDGKPITELPRPSRKSGTG